MTVKSERRVECPLTVVTISVITGSTVSLPTMYFSSLDYKHMGKILMGTGQRNIWLSKANDHFAKHKIMV